MPKTLILLPTAAERRWASGLVEQLSEKAHVELCGFGPVVAGIRTAQLIAEHHPQRVLLLGIAGAIDAELQVGEAYEFDQVACYGIGVGCGASFQTAKEMGWSQWSSDNLDSDQYCFDDTIQLSPWSGFSSSESSRLLLTVCAASAGAIEVARHRQKFPQAMAEDMEGFAVAAACKLARVPLRILRGISNMAGDREHKHWQSATAMQAVLQLALATIVD